MAPSWPRSAMMPQFTSGAPAKMSRPSVWLRGGMRGRLDPGDGLFQQVRRHLHHLQRDRQGQIDAPALDGAQIATEALVHAGLERHPVLPGEGRERLRKIPHVLQCFYFTCVTE